MHLRKVTASLNSGEQLFAKYVLVNPGKVIGLPIAMTRKNSGACVDAIIRLCRRLGFKGYADFKITLACELGNAGFSRARANGSPFEAAFCSYGESLRKTAGINLPLSVERASNALAKARRIQLFSAGMSFTASSNSLFSSKGLV